MSSVLAPNNNVPAIPPPMASLPSLVQVCTSLKQGVESLGGTRGPIKNRAVTFNDLIALGLVSTQLVAATGTPTDIVDVSTKIVSPYVVSGYTGSGLFTGSQVVALHRCPVQVTFPKNFGPIAIAMQSEFGSMVNAAGAPVFNIQQCLAANDPTSGGSWTTIGTATFTSAGHAATMASVGGAEHTCAEGDFVRVVSPASPDASLTQVFFALVGTR